MLNLNTLFQVWPEKCRVEVAQFHPDTNQFNRSRSFIKLVIEAGFLLECIGFNAFPLITNRDMIRTSMFMYVTGFR